MSKTDVSINVQTFLLLDYTKFVEMIGVVKLNVHSLSQIQNIQQNGLFWDNLCIFDRKISSKGYKIAFDKSEYGEVYSIYCKKYVKYKGDPLFIAAPIKIAGDGNYKFFESKDASYAAYIQNLLNKVYDTNQFKVRQNYETKICSVYIDPQNIKKGSLIDQNQIDENELQISKQDTANKNHDENLEDSPSAPKTLDHKGATESFGQEIVSGQNLSDPATMLPQLASVNLNENEDSGATDLLGNS